MAERLESERLILRSWAVADAAAALDVYGHPDVSRWLSPVMSRVPDLPAMRVLLEQWVSEDLRMISPSGRWAIERREDALVIGGGSLLPLPPRNEDLEIGWQLRPDCWGQGYASEATHVLAQWAFAQDLDEIFAVVKPENTRAAAAVRRNGMHWVGETSKYFGRTMEVFRLRSAELDRTAPEAFLPRSAGTP